MNPSLLVRPILDIDAMFSHWTRCGKWSQLLRKVKLQWADEDVGPAMTGIMAPMYFAGRTSTPQNTADSIAKAHDL